MARSRNIKPSLFKNELLGQADPFLTLLFINLWCLADKEGRLEDRPLRIKAETFPYREELNINRYLTELQQLGFIHRYQHAQTKIIQVISFSKHQSPHKTERPSELPEYLEKSDSCTITDIKPLNNECLTVKESLIPDSLLLIPDSLSKTDNFIKFWDLYPKKVAKKTTLKIWMNGKFDIDVIIKDLENRIANHDQWKDKQYIPNPSTYLNQERWNDEIIKAPVKKGTDTKMQRAAQAMKDAMGGSNARLISIPK